MIYYIIVFVLLLVSELIYFKIADKFNIIDKPNLRSSHTSITIRGGGIIFYIGALTYFFSNGFQYMWFIWGLTIITLISMWDDIKPVSQKRRLIYHITAMILMIYELGILTDNKWWIIILALFICTGTINAYNFMDGINGITGGYSLVVLLSLYYINDVVVRFIQPELIGTVIVSVLVFCLFNFRKKAKSFAGDVGSVSIAFIILFLIGKLIITTEDFSWFILLTVYGVDSVLTIIHRLILHENVGLPHRKHVYQIMANELKIPHVVVTIIYMALQTIVVYLYLLYHGYLMFIGSILILSVVYILFKKKYYHLHEEYLKSKQA